LPQAKTYRGSCGLGPGLLLDETLALQTMPIHLDIRRGNATVFIGETNSDQMKRTAAELVDWLGRELDFPQGVFLMTGTGLVPGEDFTLQVGDVMRVTIGELVLENRVME
jgi:2-dehydro-3-deoxy-D-arabinonate dehydratase